MAVFLSASDETLGAGIFHHIGYVARLSEWTEKLIPAWEEQVLKVPPPIDEFHMTELRSRSWREKHGLSRDDAESRIDSAVDVIHQSGLHSIRSTIDASHYGKKSKGFRYRPTDPRRGPTEFPVDLPSFFAYAYITLHTCSMFPDAEKVDFVIEEKREVLAEMRDCWKQLPDSFRRCGLPRIAEMMGELIPGDKKRVPLQAADVLCWHTQRCVSHRINPKAFTFSDFDKERLSKLTRLGFGSTWPKETVEELFSGLFEDWRGINGI